MINKLLKFILVLLFFVSFNQLNAQFQFQYNGPDTLYLDNNCNVVLEWGHPNTPTVTSTIGNTISSFDIFSISDGYTMGGTISQETTVTITYKVIDSQLNSAFFLLILLLRII